jgi:acetyl esterase
VMVGVALAWTAHGLSARTVDDSYTISRRFERYRGHYDGLAWPMIRPVAGQEMVFDRVYKTLGERDLAMDIFLPPRLHSRHQGLVLVHGGAWRSGTKAHFYALANLLAQRGYTVFLPEYRLSPEAPYPAGVQDIADAMAWAKAHARDYRLAAGRIALGGASSGGQMAALVAMSAKDDAAPNALIDMDGVLDFTTPVALTFENAAGEGSSAAKWLGGPYERMADRWREASALSHVGPPAPPTLVISSGIAHFTEGREALFAALRAHGTPAQFYSFTNAPHDFWLFAPWIGPTVAQIDQFLRSIPPARQPTR